MKKLMLDSGIVSAFMNRRDGVFEKLQVEVRLGVRIGTCVPVVAEIASGIELSASRDRNMEILKRNLRSLTIWPFDERAAFTYGLLSAELRKKGRPMQSIDMMLAAVAINLNNCTVITTDSDLEAVPKLSVQIWPC
jgi:tRNA(fMet)-specific endonuclease VapC